MAQTRYDRNYRLGEGMGFLPRRQPMGMHPNYSAGRYRGQRYDEEPRRAPYGRYRREHEAELEPSGGSRGRYTGAGMLRDLGPMRPSGPYRPPPVGRGQHGGWPEPDVGYGRQRPRGSVFSGVGYDRFFGGRSGPRDRGDRGRRRFPADRGRMFDASRPLGYDGGFDRYGGYRAGGFNEGFLGSGF